MKTLKEQRRAVLLSKKDLDREILRTTDEALKTELREQAETLLDVAETLTRVESLLSFFSWFQE